MRLNGSNPAGSACLQHFCLITEELQKSFYTKTVLNKKQQKICELESATKVRRVYQIKHQTVPFCPWNEYLLADSFNLWLLSY